MTILQFTSQLVWDVLYTASHNTSTKMFLVKVVWWDISIQEPEWE